MPKIPIDYSKGLIYMIKHKDDVNNEYIYVGSTTNFIQRKYAHKTSCNNPKSKEYNFKEYIYIRENGGWNDFIMLLVEKFPCNDNNELRKREDDLMVEYTNRLNKNRASRSVEEWCEDNKEYFKEVKRKYYENHKEHIKKYRENHKEHIKEVRQKWNEDNKETIKEVNKKYYENHKEVRQKWNEDNKETIKEVSKKYYENHKETIKEKIEKKITCECGSIIRHDSMSKHKKSIKHLNYLELSS